MWIQSPDFFRNCFFRTPQGNLQYLTAFQLTVQQAVYAVSAMLFSRVHFVRFNSFLIPFTFSTDIPGERPVLPGLSQWGRTWMSGPGRVLLLFIHLVIDADTIRLHLVRRSFPQIRARSIKFATTWIKIDYPAYGLHGVQSYITIAGVFSPRYGLLADASGYINNSYKYVNRLCIEFFPKHSIGTKDDLVTQALRLDSFYKNRILRIHQTKQPKLFDA